MSCVFCKADKPSWITAKYQMSVEFDRGIFDSHGILQSESREGRVKKLIMTPNEEKHAKFFSEEAVLVQNMTDVDLDEHIQELEDIAREAKARILASTEEKRNRRAKSGNKAWKVEPLGPDPTVSDSLNKVKQRSARMSKLDSMRAKMAALGIPDADLDIMMSKMIAQARKEPEALRAEAKLKGDLKEHKPPTIPTEEEREAVRAQKAAFEAQDRADEEAEKQAKALKEAMEKEAEKQEAEAAPVHSNKDEKLILVVDNSEAKEKEEAERKRQALVRAQALFGPNVK